MEQEHFITSINTIAGNDGVVYIEAQTAEDKTLTLEIGAWELLKDLPAITEMCHKAFYEEMRRVEQDQKDREIVVSKFWQKLFSDKKKK